MRRHVAHPHRSFGRLTSSSPRRRVAGATPRLTATLLVAALVAAACGDDGGSAATDVPPGIDIETPAQTANPPAADNPDADNPDDAADETSTEGAASNDDSGVAGQGDGDGQGNADGQGDGDATGAESAEPPATFRPADAPDSAPGDTSTTTLPAGPLPEPSVDWTLVGSFNSPVEVTSRPGDPRVMIVEQPGRVVAVDDVSETVLADISGLVRSGGEQGLLGLAYHPTDALAYVYYTNQSGDSVVAEYAIDPSSGAFDRDSARIVLTVEQPFSNHNGGELAFGPDAMLYIGLGDGGSADDPERASLDMNSLLGKILRIDPRQNGDNPYTIPADNPYAGLDGARPEIWASGLRNPWRFSFDPATGDLWIADVGQRDFEEISRAPAGVGGLSFGWSAFEGFEPFNADQQAAADTPRPDGNATQTDPVLVYRHENGNCSVSGGTVARSGPIADLAGWYVFGDYCTGRVWGYDTTSPATEPRIVELSQFDALAAVATGPDGTVYLVSNGGPVAALVPSA